MRTLFYATNGLGLGHVTRLLAISRALLKQDPAHEVLMLSRCEAGPFPYEDAPFTIRIPGTSRARKSGLSPKSYYQTTQPLLWQTVSSFDPHLLVTDTFPEGPEGELAPIMKWPIRKAFVYRDSRPEVFREEELRPRLAPYQLILVAHDPETVILPPWLRKDPRVRHTGTVSEGSLPDPAQALRHRLGTTGEKTVLITLGGGGDPEVEPVLSVILQKLRDQKVGIFVATGPLSRKIPDGLTAREWFPAWPITPWLPAFDFAVASGGYNTVTELGQAGIPSLLIPFDRDLDDQRKRILEAEKAGWAFSVASRGKTEIEQGIDRLLREGDALKKGPAGGKDRSTGADTAASFLLDLLTGAKTSGVPNTSTTAETKHVMVH